MGRPGYEASIQYVQICMQLVITNFLTPLISSCILRSPENVVTLGLLISSPTTRHQTTLRHVLRLPHKRTLILNFRDLNVMLLSRYVCKSVWELCCEDGQAFVFLERTYYTQCTCTPYLGQQFLLLILVVEVGTPYCSKTLSPRLKLLIFLPRIHVHVLPYNYIQAVMDQTDATSQTEWRKPCNAAVQYSPRGISDEEAESIWQGSPMKEFLNQVCPRCYSII